MSWRDLARPYLEEGMRAAELRAQRDASVRDEAPRQSWRETAARYLAPSVETDGAAKLPNCQIAAAPIFPESDQAVTAKEFGTDFPAKLEVPAKLDAEGLPAAWLERLETLHHEPAPVGLRHEEWLRRIDRVLSFARERGAQLADAGWTYGECFATGRNWRRLDWWGAAWIVDGDNITRIDADAIESTTRSGSKLSLRRAGRVAVRDE